MTRARSKQADPDPSTGVGFSEPPPERVLRYDWAAIAKTCRRRPGKWRLIFTGDKQTYVTAIRQGSMPAVSPKAGFEMRTANNNSKVKPRVCDLWLRYVPENDQTKSKES